MSEIEIVEKSFYLIVIFMLILTLVSWGGEK